MVNYRDYLIAQAVKDQQISKIIVFGSYAHGTAREDSDLDVLIIKDDADTYQQAYPAVSALFEPRIIPMDILIKTPTAYQQRLAMQDPFMLEIAKNGVVVYER